MSRSLHRALTAESVRVQSSMRPLLQSVAAASTSGTIPRVHERALRLVPRGLYLASVPPEQAYSNTEVTLTEGGAPVEPPHVDVLILQKLRLAPGQRFLEIGSGSGYLTALAAYIVGPAGAATGVDASREAVAAASQLCDALHAAGRLGADAARPRFIHRDGGTLLELGETWHAVVVSGHVPVVWIKTLRKLLTPKGRLVACTEGKLRLFEHGSGAASSVIATYVFPPMTLSRRLKRGELAAAAPARGERRGRSGGGGKEGEGLALRVPGQGLLAGGEKSGNSAAEEEAAMAEVMREVETEEMSGLLVSATDVTVCRTPKGRKCRLGEGGFGVVYKALMNGVDEVAVKLVKVCTPLCTPLCTGTCRCAISARSAAAGGA